MKISDSVKEVLVKSRVEGDKLYLPETQLERKLYVEVNKILEDLGGKWNKKAKSHIFTSDPSDVLDEIIVTGEWTDKKKEYQFFPTPKDIVKKMIEYAEIKDTDVLLEPSAGKGSILDEFPKGNSVTVIELMEDNCKNLIEKGYDNVNQKDFLEVETFADKIIMNPPFSKQQDVKHILHAWDCLKEGGKLVAIVSESPFFRENALSQEFREWIEEHNVEVYDLDSGAFKESGTMVKTRMIVASK